MKGNSTQLHHMKFPHWLVSQRFCAVGLAGLMAIAPTLFPATHQAAQANPLSDDSDIPLELSFGDLEEGSWRQLQTAGLYSQYEFAEPFLSVLSLIGLSNIINNSYFTQGETIKMAGQEYIVAYRFPTLTSNLNLEDLFSVWDSGQDCDLGGLESKFITRDSKVKLSLLHPLTVGTLNDIQVVDVEEVVSASEAEVAKMEERCAAAEAEGKVDEAIANVDEILWSQEFLWLDESRFTANFDELDLLFDREAEDYTYTVNLANATTATTAAIATSETGFHIVGAISMIDDSDPDNPYFSTILCESTEPGGVVPPAPVFDKQLGYFVCSAGSYETFAY